MALSNRQRVQGAQDCLLDGLIVYVERTLKRTYGDDWVGRVTARFHGTPVDTIGKPIWDMQLVVKSIAEFWHEAFADKLKPEDRNHVFELRAWRNALAHDQPFTYDDTYRALDTMHRVASRLGLPCAEDLLKERDEVMRVKFAEQARSVSRSVTAVEGRVPEGFKVWRDVILPHADVREGNFQTAEFAADLAQVFKGDAGLEYGEPRAFFGRTFITAGLRDLLVNALRRLSRGEGDPVVELQTNFGGGKTHSMLALYHLFGGVASSELTGLEEVHRLSNVPTAPTGVRRAVLVGTDLGTTKRLQADGTTTNTIWGELAYQLAGSSGYAIVREADEHRVNPGAEALTKLLQLAAPSLILIDEWVALLRELYNRDDLPLGSFDSNISFVQSLTEAAKRVPQTLLVASLPQSRTEVAGHGGSAALDALKETFKRVQSTWLPAGPEESFEIVRRRLFEPLKADAYRHVDAVVKAFADHYAVNRADFPAGASEPSFSRKLKVCYPIHPNLFDALFGTWSTLERFQRTRGVLRFMALVIHRLWQQGDRNLLIMPATVPLSDTRVQAELRNYLGEAWEAIMNQEVDGPDSLPVRVETEDKSGRFGQVAAARRVTRSVFLATAPRGSTAHTGVDARSIYLASVQPGETIGPFSDALRRTQQQAVYMYSDGAQYWFSAQPSLNRKATELAQQFHSHEVEHEIERRLRETARSRGAFAGVRVTSSGADVPDEPKRPAVHLVILPPNMPHARGSHDSPAYERAYEIVTKRGNADRLGRNTVVFLAADRARYGDLETRTREYLAWHKIHSSATIENLTPSDTRQAEARVKDTDKRVDGQLADTYTYVLTPVASAGASVSLELDEERMNGSGTLVERVQKKLDNSGKLVKTYGARSLQLKLDTTLWSGRPHITVQKLLEYYAQYVYLERLESDAVLLSAIQTGVNSPEPYFAYADDVEGERYVNLRFGEAVQVQTDEHAVIVRADVARQQRLAERSRPTPNIDSDGFVEPTPGGSSSDEWDKVDPIVLPLPTPHKLPRSVYAEGVLDTARMVKRFTDIYDEVIQNLLDTGAQVEVEVVIRANVPRGLEAHEQRAVLENGRNLGLRVNLESDA